MLSSTENTLGEVPGTVISIDGTLFHEASSWVVEINFNYIVEDVISYFPLQPIE